MMQRKVKHLRATCDEAFERKTSEKKISFTIPGETRSVIINEVL
jgi:hypothetical protein